MTWSLVNYFFGKYFLIDKFCMTKDHSNKNKFYTGKVRSTCCCSKKGTTQKANASLAGLSFLLYHFSSLEATLTSQASGPKTVSDPANSFTCFSGRRGCAAATAFRVRAPGVLPTAHSDWQRERNDVARHGPHWAVGPRQFVAKDRSPGADWGPDRPRQSPATGLSRWGKPHVSIC